MLCLLPCGEHARRGDVPPPALAVRASPLGVLSMQDADLAGAAVILGQRIE